MIKVETYTTDDEIEIELSLSKQFKEMKKSMITLKDFTPNNTPTQKQVASLGQFLIENFEDEIGGNKRANGEGVIEMSVRLLLELKEIRKK